MGKYSDSAAAIIREVGGPENIVSLTHCATRLRFVLRDATQIDTAKIDAIPDVLSGVPQGADKYQVVIGGGVSEMFREIQNMPEMAKVGSGEMSDADVKAAERAKAKGKNAWVDAFFDFLSDCFRPIIGVLLGASIIVALTNLFIGFGWLEGDAVSTSTVFVKSIWQAVFYFLPLMIAYNGAKKLNIDPWVAVMVMGAVMTPQYMALKNPAMWASVFSSEEAAASAESLLNCTTNSVGTETCTTSVFGITMQLNDYSANVFVPLFMVVVLAALYKGLQKIIPPSIHLVFVPFLSMLIMVPITAFLIGPIGVWVGNGLGTGLGWMNSHAPFVFAILIPMLYPFLVPLGLHWPLNALMLANIQSLGYDFIQGPMGAWNFACFGATAGVLYLSIKDKDAQMRQTAGGALAAGLLGGVSEPSLYGIHLRYKKVYSRLLAGCFAGGLTIAILGYLIPHTLVLNGAEQSVHGVTTDIFAFTSLFTVTVFKPMWIYAIAIAVAFFTAMFLVITLDYRTPEQKEEIKARIEAEAKAAAVEAAAGITGGAAAAAAAAPAAAAVATAVATKALAAPVAGTTIALADCGDKVFASGALGEGIAIDPTENVVVAPVAGTVASMFDTGHAYGIQTDDGVEVLIHIGIDTVKMNGEGFTPQVAMGDHVEVGTPLAVVDFDKVKEAGYSASTIMLVTNTASLASVTPHAGSTVSAGDVVVDIEK